MLVIDLMPLSCSKIFCIFICLFNRRLLLFFQSFCRYLCIDAFPSCPSFFWSISALSSSSFLSINFNAAVASICCSASVASSFVLLLPPVCSAACLPRPFHLLLLLLQLLAPRSFVLLSFFLEFRTVLLDTGECFTGGGRDFLSHCASRALRNHRVVFRVASLATQKSEMRCVRPVIAPQIDSVVCLSISAVSSASFVDQHIV